MPCFICSLRTLSTKSISPKTESSVVSLSPSLYEQKHMAIWSESASERAVSLYSMDKGKGHLR
ncbi:unnamed protein product [Musa acuminata subsp. malaccensis]|uniref:(wild Malaysian banana) hypothetical protein n=1 Tax=Musa acuminata subsp. malaccensis TaxID=214687 RepID=A0A804L9P4_MUSAM|nr:unnamed protein product [Musa acuminata subsp. malaccensis]